jgi:hypothetical protein
MSHRKYIGLLHEENFIRNIMKNIHLNDQGTDPVNFLIKNTVLLEVEKRRKRKVVIVF